MSKAPAFAGALPFLSIRALHVQFFRSALCGYQVRLQPFQFFNGIRNGVKQAEIFRCKMFHVLASFLRQAYHRGRVEKT